MAAIIVPDIKWTKVSYIRWLMSWIFGEIEWENKTLAKMLTRILLCADTFLQFLRCAQWPTSDILRQKLKRAREREWKKAKNKRYHLLWNSSNSTHVNGKKFVHQANVCSQRYLFSSGHTFSHHCRPHPSHTKEQDWPNLLK